MRCLRVLSFLAVLGVLVQPSISTGQSTLIAPRITSPVNESSLVTLTGNVSSRARAEFDAGAASPSTQLSHVRLMLSRSSAQEAALNKYLAELQDKSSPNYHKWLTPAQFGKLYGPADSDIAAIVAWLQSRGLRVDGVSSGRTNIAFSGSVAQIEQAFHTSIHSYQANGEQFFSNNSNPKIPAALAGVVSGVARLNTIRPRPQHVAGRSGIYDPSTHRLKAAQPAQSRRPRAQYTTGSGTGSDPYLLFMVPGDAATIYDTPNTKLNANFTTGTSIIGSGVTIGVGGDAVIQSSTVASFRNLFLGDANLPIITNVDGTTSTVDTDEAYIDTELAGGLAPGATIHFYTASTLDVAIEQMLADNSVDIFSLSFGECELFLTTPENALINGWWQQAATQGIAVTVATGDNGSAGCDVNSPQDAIASGGLMVSGYASTPYNIAVGGTDLIGLLDQTTFPTYVLPPTDPKANSAATLYRTALQYIPESTWNDSTAADGPLDSNILFTDPTVGTNINAGSGGPSSCSTNTSTDAIVGACTNGYAKPAWQTSATLGMPADGVRDIPDISLMSGAGGDNAAWLVCTDEPWPDATTNTMPANCALQTDGSFPFFGFGGTSTASPAFAGILAMVQQHSGSRLGQAAKQLYDIYNGPAAASIFNDITVGNNSVYCASGSTNCVMNTAGNLFLTGYDSTIGYDLATGLGSVDVNQLIAYWGTATGDSPVTVTVTPASTTVDTLHSLNVSVAVADPSNLGTPYGSVTISGGGYVAPLPATTVDSFGNATLTIPASALKAGAVTLTVLYNGDASDTTYSVGTGTASVTVTKVASSLTVTPASTTIAPSASLVVTGTVSGAGSKPTGTVTLTGGGYTSSATTLSSGNYTITIPANSLALGADTLTVNYSGDNIYNTSSGNGSVTVPGFKLSATPLTITAGASTGNASTLTVTPIAGYAGAVTFTAKVTSAPSGAVSVPTFTISPTALTFTSGTATPQTAQVTVASTPIPSYVRAPSGSGMAWFKAAGGTTILGLLFFFLPLGTRRGRKILGVLALVFAVGFTIAGCGGSGSGGGGGGGGKTTPSVTVSPAKGAIATTDTLSVAVSVSGGTSTATGTVTLTSGSYSSAATSLASGAATIVVPAGKLPVGTQTLTASYSGDSNFNTATGANTVKVGAPATTAGTYTVTVTGTDAATTTAPTTFTMTVN